MDDENKKLEVSPEEQKAEEEAQKEVKDEELRAKVAEEFGIDPDDEDKKDLLDKLFAKEKSHREKLSGAIKQKINWRDKAKKTSEHPSDKPKPGEPPKKEEAPDIGKLVDQKVNERLEERDLDSLGLPDDLKKEVRELAKLKGISVREAAQHPYIKSRKEEIERQQRIDNASPGRSGKGSGSAKFDPSKPLDRNNYNMNTPEGLESWKKDRAARDRWRAEHGE